MLAQNDDIGPTRDGSNSLSWTHSERLIMRRYQWIAMISLEWPLYGAHL
jgi:hypothetical protein